MATYERFEELPVWNTAADLFDRVDDFLEQAPPRLRPTFRAQLERAALSVSNNISEGFERGSTKELLAYIYIARGSSGEVRSMLRVAARRPWMPRELLPVIEAIISTAISCSRQLRAWAGSLQRSSIKGHRHIDVPTAAKPAKRKGASNSLKFEI